MRIIIMFDMPVETYSQQVEYRKFHKNLIRNGFLMMQYSVYTRYCHNEVEVTKYVNIMNKIKPKEGEVRILKITDIQYNNMIILNGTRKYREELEAHNPRLFEID